MRIAVILGLVPALLAAGCGGFGIVTKPEIEACEAFVQNSLRSPSTYKQIGASSSQEPGKQITTVLLSYDADNTYGTPIRGIQLCSFETTKTGRLVYEPKVSATLAIADRALGISDTCCTRRATPVSNEPSNNVSTDDGPLMNAEGPL